MNFFIIFSIFLKIFVSNKWGFTKYKRDEFEQLMSESRLEFDGVNVKHLPDHGPLSEWKKRQTA